MPVPALSLLGFMDQQLAFNYLRNLCLCPDTSDAALRKMWLDAQKRIGRTRARAGQPDIKDIPPGHEPYLAGVQNNPRFGDTVGPFRWSLKLVEIAPLLAYQFHVETNRGASVHAAGLTKPSVEAMLPLCLPHNAAACSYVPLPQGNSREGSLLLRSPDLNFRVLGAGPLGSDATRMVAFMGIACGESSPSCT